MFVRDCGKGHIFPKRVQDEPIMQFNKPQAFEKLNAQFLDCVYFTDIPDINNILTGDMIKSNNIDGFSLVKGLLPEWLEQYK